MAISPPASPTIGQNLTTQFSNAQSTNNGTQSGLSATNQQPIFTNAQLGMQNQAAGLLNNILTGHLQNFGPPQAAYDAAFANFNKYQAPQLASQYGAGSPAIGSAQEQLQQQMAGMWGTMALPNALNAFNAAAQYGFTPIAMNSTNLQNQQQQNATNSSGNTTNVNLGEILGGLMGSLPGVI